MVDAAPVMPDVTTNALDTLSNVTAGATYAPVIDPLATVCVLFTV